MQPLDSGLRRNDEVMKLSAPLTCGLIVCILLVSAPHASHLPLWVSAECAALLLWRAWLTRAPTCQRR